MFVYVCFGKQTVSLRSPKMIHVAQPTWCGEEIVATSEEKSSMTSSGNLFFSTVYCSRMCTELCRNVAEAFGTYQCNVQ